MLTRMVDCYVVQTRLRDGQRYELRQSSYVEACDTVWRLAQGGLDGVILDRRWRD